MNELGVPGYSSFGTKQKIQEGKWGIKIKRHGLCTVLVGRVTMVSSWGLLEFVKGRGVGLSV